MKSLLELLLWIYVENMGKYNLKSMKWERSDSCSLLIIKHTISSEVKNAIPDPEYAKELLTSMEDHFKYVLTIEDGL